MDHQRFLRLARITAPVVVLGRFLNQNAIGITRDLGRLGVPVLIADCTAAGSRVPSRYAAKLVIPDPYHDEPGFLRALEALGSDLPQKAVLFPVRDDCLLPVARAQSRLGETFLLPFCSGEVMARCNDKWQQLQGALRAGVDTPRSILLRSSEDLEALDGTMPFPAILKPTTPLAGRRHLGLKIIAVPSRTDLRAAYDRMSECGDLLLQDRIPGNDDQVYYLGSYVDASSRPLAVFTGRRLRQYPRGSGSTRVAESVWMPEVAEAGLRLLQELGHHGVSMVEFKRDPRDGRLKLIEVNTRHYGTHSLAAASGVNLSAAAYRDALGDPVMMPRQRDGVRWVHATTEVIGSVQEMAHGRLSPREWAAALKGVRLDAVIMPDDPLPGAVDVVYTAGRIASRLAARLAPGRRL
jgi:D-aspartate ligase